MHAVSVPLELLLNYLKISLNCVRPGSPPWWYVILSWIIRLLTVFLWLHEDWIVDVKPSFMDIVQFNADEIQYKHDENPMNKKTFQSNADPALAESKDHITLQG